MAYNRRQAESLLDAAELQLFDASLASALSALTAAELKAKITRTRRLRDKQRDLLQRQRLASRAATGSKGGRSGVANVRTADKATLLDEVLARFEKRAELFARKADSEARREAAKRAAAIRKSAKPKAKAKSKVASRPSKPAARSTADASPALGGAPKTTVSKRATRAPAKGGGKLPGKKDPKAANAKRASVGRVRAVTQRNQAKRDAR
jgi:hypothetical protein